MPLGDPTTPTEWMAVAGCRNNDAASLRKADRRVASLYLQGFAAECFAKALLARSDQSPKTVPRQYDLMTLLEMAGFARKSLRLELRAAAENRDVSLRYQADEDASIQLDELDTMNQLVSWIERRALRITQRARAKAARAKE